MKTGRRRGRGGFTLLELLVAVMLLAVMSMMLFEVFGTSTRLVNLSLGRQEAATNARAVMEFMQHELEGSLTEPGGKGFYGVTPAEGQPAGDLTTAIPVLDPTVISGESFQVKNPGTGVVTAAKIMPGTSVVSYQCATAGIGNSDPVDYAVIYWDWEGSPLNSPASTPGVSTYYSRNYAQGVARLKWLNQARVLYFLSDDHKLYRAGCTDLTRPIKTEDFELFAVNVVDFKVEYWDGTAWVPNWNSVTAVTAKRVPLPEVVRLTVRVTDSRHIGQYNGKDDDGKNGVDDPDEVDDQIVDTFTQVVYLQVRKP